MAKQNGTIIVDNGGAIIYYTSPCSGLIAHMEVHPNGQVRAARHDDCSVWVNDVPTAARIAVTNWGAFTSPTGYWDVVDYYTDSQAAHDAHTEALNDEAARQQEP